MSDFARGAAEQDGNGVALIMLGLVLASLGGGIALGKMSAREQARAEGYAAAVDSVREAAGTTRDTVIVPPYIIVRTTSPQFIRTEYVRFGEGRCDTIFTKGTR